MSTLILFEIVPFKADADFFSGVFEKDGVRIALIAISAITSLFLIPFVTGVVMFECLNSDQRIISRLVSSLATSYVTYLIFVQIPDIVRFIFGPLSENFCFCHYLLKSTLSLQHILIFDAIAVVRYIFIFWMKNPTSFQDGFWNLFINIFILIFSVTSQFIFIFLPGRQPLAYYTCSGLDPRSNSDPSKGFNPIMIFFQLGSVILHCFVNIKIEISNLNNTQSLSNKLINRRKTFDNEAVGKWTLNFALIICLAAMALTTGKVNSLPSVESNLCPNYFYLNVYHLVNPVLLGCLTSVLYLVKHKKLRSFCLSKLQQLWEIDNVGIHIYS